MAKIVYNACFGGFGLSVAAVMRYAELKGVQLWPECDQRLAGLMHYWTVPPERRPPSDPTGAQWAAMSKEERCAHNEAWKAAQIYERDIPRTDPDLVQVVEELGKAANGKHANLAIIEIPDGSRYRIDEYDGSESVETPDSYEWKVA